MCEDDAILVFQRIEQLLGGVGVGRKISPVLDQHMRGAVDLLALAHEQHVAVAAEAGVARPLVAREDDERAVLVVIPRQVVQLVPECCRDLEVVSLVAHAVEERTVASKFDQLPRRIGADRLLRLAVQIAPIRLQRRLGGNTQRVADANHRAGFVEHLDEQVSGLADGQAFD